MLGLTSTILFPCIIAFVEIGLTDTKPLVFTRSNLKWNTTNELFITVSNSANKLIDIYVEIRALHPKLLIFRQTFQAKVAGSMMRVKFFVPGGMKRSDLYRIVIQAQNDNELFEKTIPGAPDIRNIFLQIDKTIYKPTDTVHLRALPLTTNGKLYNGPVDFSLMNADGFELIHKNKSVINNGFINVEFQVPQHLNFGEWKIIARADRYKPTIKSITFQVQQYEVPPFRLHIMAKETDDITIFELDVLARHANGRAISGQITVLCDCNANKIRSSIPSDSRKFSLCILHSGKDNEA